MGMDVYGKKPTDPKGEYFRANVWYWRPLWIYMEHISPTLTSKVKYPQSNDGDGLSAKDARVLSQLLKSEIDSGKAEKYIEEYYEYLDSLPQSDCNYCDSTGKRTWTTDGIEVEKVCNGCNGTLKLDHYLKSYPMHIDIIKEFQQFLYHCGGFQIW